mmetsp:Transcript_150899/g.484959  ORF Transcript_150899/g.484959 Transcript_150899/m.484959 type:complete len:321 (-) Transcript_150899:1441-2403(-)
MWSCLRIGRQSATLDLHAIRRQAPCEVQVRERSEVIAIPQSDCHRGVPAEGQGLSLPCQALKGDGLLDLLRLEAMRARGPVRPHQAVDAEVVVGRGAFAAEVTAVGPDLFAVDGLCDDALIDPIPDEAALQYTVLVNHVPIFLEAAQGVAHRVRVLHHDERQGACRTLVLLAVLCQLGLARIHGAEYVRVVIDGLHIVRRPCGLQPCVLVLHRPRRITLLQPHVCTVVVDAVPRLVSERPEDDAWMVLVPLHVALHPGHVASTPLRFVAQGLVPMEVYAVALDVGLVDHVQAVLVAELVPERVVGVVRATDRIEVVGLHE